VSACYQQVKGIAMGKIFSAYVKQPVMNWNIENRVHRFIDKKEKRVAPRHPSTSAAFEQLVAGIYNCIVFKFIICAVFHLEFLYTDKHCLCCIMKLYFLLDIVKN